MDFAGGGGLLEEEGSEGGGDCVELMGGEAGCLEKFGRDDEIGQRREFRGDKPGLGGRWTTDARDCGNGKRKFSGGGREEAIFGNGEIADLWEEEGERQREG